MHVLYLTDALPFPLTSGWLRHYFLIRELSRHHRVTLFSRVGGSLGKGQAEALEALVSGLRIFEGPRRGGRLRSGLFSGHELRRAMSRAIQKLSQSDPFQVIITSKECLQVLSKAPTVPIVVDVCDAASQRVLGSMSFSPLHLLPRLAVSYVRMRILEQRSLARAAHCLFISERDRSWLLEPGDEKASILPNGVDTNDWKRTSSHLGAHNVVFTGAMDYRPNVDAALRLVRMLESVRLSRPLAELWLVGRNPSSEIVAAASGRPWVQVTGLVDDIRPYLDQAAVFCAPLRFSSGVQNKVLEALAMEVPSLVTPVVAEGLRPEDDGVSLPLRVLEGDGEFEVELIDQLDRSEHGRATPQIESRAFVEKYFQWAVSGARLIQNRGRFGRDPRL